jgi:hypothetical protein
MMKRKRKRANSEEVQVLIAMEPQVIGMEVWDGYDSQLQDSDSQKMHNP